MKAHRINDNFVILRQLNSKGFIGNRIDRNLRRNKLKITGYD